jgi:DNA helicase II / ATP-dependent DNA helicase PcrA
MSARITTLADEEVAKCLSEHRSFALIAGAGSGKTTSLVDAMDQIRSGEGSTLRKNGQRVACITYTKRAVGVIHARLGADDLFSVSTLHSFLWREIGRFQQDIREALALYYIPLLIEKSKERDNGGSSQTAIKARERAAILAQELTTIGEVTRFIYDDVAYSNYSEGRLSHDDIIEIAAYLLAERPNFRRLLGNRYPFIFVDEAQDTFVPIIEGLNQVCAGDGPPVVGYFGDPWQQIYEGRAGDFRPPEGGKVITKVENFRSAPQVICFLNAFRKDVEQVPAGKNIELEGSVSIRLVKAEAPGAPRNRYTDEQLVGALAAMDEAIDSWGWTGRTDVIRLFLVRQMIARRAGFQALNHLFTGEFASKRAQDDYEDGEHLLLKPFVQVICPLLDAHQNGHHRQVIDILRSSSPAFSTSGPNARRKLKEMVSLSKKQLEDLSVLWATRTVKEVLCFARDNDLLVISDRLAEHLTRQPRAEEYDEQEHAEEKGDWLADALFSMSTGELQSYCNFIMQNTPYSTQHGVKGEEFSDVLVVYDDVEAAWNLYSFTKLLIPQTAGDPTDGQRERGKKLAYVSFSRARQNLRILLFTPSPVEARKELLEQKLFEEDQIVIA